MQIGENFQTSEHAAFQWQGSEQAALLIHGYPGTPAEMRPIANVLHELGWSVSAPLLPGFGSELEALSEKTAQDWLNAVEQAYLSLRNRGKETIVVGYSMGGALAMQLAAKHPPAGLILFAPLYQIDNWIWKALPLLRIIFPKVRISRFVDLDFDDPATREGIEKFMPGIDLDDPDVQNGIRNYEIPVTMFNEIRRTGQLAYQVAPQIHTPTLVFQGNQDDLILPRMTRRLVNRLNSSAEYIEVDGTHDLLDTDSVAWSTIRTGVTRFVNTLPLGDRTV